jgi:lactate permease
VLVADRNVPFTNSVGIDPVITVAANASGGVTGKMISPQSIAVGAASVGLVGKESELFRFTFKHSFIMLFVICIITVLQAYVFKWIIPAYQMLGNQLAAATTDIGIGILPGPTVWNIIGNFNKCMAVE